MLTQNDIVLFLLQCFQLVFCVKVVTYGGVTNSAIVFGYQSTDGNRHLWCVSKICSSLYSYQFQFPVEAEITHYGNK